MKAEKTLYLVRHAKSSWGQTDLDDSERPLNKRGKENAPDMAERLAHNVSQNDGEFPRPELIISSPAVRASTTAYIIAKALGLPNKNVVLDERLYMRGTTAMLEALEEYGNQQTAIMIVGHNPDLTQLHNQLNSLYIDNIPTCAIATIRFVYWRLAPATESRRRNGRFRLPQALHT